VNKDGAVETAQLLKEEQQATIVSFLLIGISFRMAWTLKN